jgi:APA family basic amino acid/polyamine antiporter
LPADTWARLIVWLAIGIAIYFLYSRRHSKIQQRTEQNENNINIL